MKKSFTSTLVGMLLITCFASTLFTPAEAINENILNDEIKKLLGNLNDITLPINITKNVLVANLTMNSITMNNPVYDNGVFWMKNGVMKINITGFALDLSLNFDVEKSGVWTRNLNLPMVIGKTTIGFDIILKDSISLANATLNIGVFNFTNDEYKKIVNWPKTAVEGIFKNLFSKQIVSLLESEKNINLDSIIKSVLGGEKFTLDKPNMKTIKMTPLVASKFVSGHVSFLDMSDDTISIRVNSLGFSIDNAVTAYKVLFWWKKTNLANHADLQGITADLRFYTHPSSSNPKVYDVDLKEVVLNVPKNTINPSTFNLFGGKNLCVFKWCADEGIAHVTNALLKISHSFLSKMVTKIAEKYVNVNDLQVLVNVH